MLSPDQLRAAAILPAEEAAADAARTRLASIQLAAAMACATSRLMGLPAPEESRRIISVLPVEQSDA